MEPGFFGPPDLQLFGVYHSAQATSREAGVVLCPPAPQEADRSHWAYRRLAEQLSRAGWHVLRFDYRGTGDSAGDLTETTAARWVEDIGLAAKELRDLSGVKQISSVGFRLGALLAARAASSGLPLESLILWEPLIGVAGWLERLEAIEAEVHEGSARDPDTLMGYQLPPRLRSEWEALDLPRAPRWSARTAVVTAAASTELGHLRAAWEASGVAARWRVVLSATADPGTGALLGNEALDQIQELLGEQP